MLTAGELCSKCIENSVEHPKSISHLALVRVVVAVEVRGAVAGRDHADVAVLRQVVAAPHCGALRHVFSDAGEALRRRGGSRLLVMCSHGTD